MPDLLDEVASRRGHGEAATRRVKAGTGDLLDEVAARHHAGATGSWEEGPPPIDEPKSVGGFLRNIPKSGMEMARNLGTMVAHPIKTVGAMGDVAAGGIQKLRHEALDAGGAVDPTTGESFDASKIPNFDAFMGEMGKRYGSLGNVANTIYNDPVGAALDASGVLSGGSTALAGRLPRIAKFLKIASEAIDPIRQSGKVLGAVGSGIARTSEAYLGKSTGVGAEVIRTAAAGADAHPQFKPAMRGELTHEDALQQVNDAVKELADRRRANYQEQLKTIDQTIEIDPKPVWDEMKKALDRFNVKVVAKMAEDGSAIPELNFDQSALRHLPGEKSKVAAMFDDVMKWGSRDGDLGPYGMDILKQGLSEMVDVAPGRGDVIVKQVHDRVRTLLEDQVPGYKEMTADYASASRFLNEVKGELSVGPKAQPGAGIRKLATALNQRADYRKHLIDTLDIELGTDIKGVISGLEMQPIMPRGIIGPFTVGAGGTTLAFKLQQYFSSPEKFMMAAAGAATFSPRLVGEVLAAIGDARNSRLLEGAGAVAGAAGKVVFNPATFRLGTTANEAERNEAPEPPPPIQ